MLYPDCTGQHGGAEYTGEPAVPLKSLEDTSQSSLWPGHVGALAIADLANRSPYGPSSVRYVCQLVDAGRSKERAFELAFGIRLADY